MGFAGVVGATGWGLSAVALAGGALLYTKGGRPALKGALVSYLALSDRVREIAAESMERFQDILAEAEAEYHELRTTPQELTVESPTPLRVPRSPTARSRTHS
jgi:hypothetical protein